MWINRERTHLTLLRQETQLDDGLWDKTVSQWNLVSNKLVKFPTWIEEITRLTFRVLVLRRHLPIRLRRWRFQCSPFVGALSDYITKMTFRALTLRQSEDFLIDHEMVQRSIMKTPVLKCRLSFWSACNLSRWSQWFTLGKTRNFSNFKGFLRTYFVDLDDFLVSVLRQTWGWWRWWVKSCQALLLPLSTWKCSYLELHDKSCTTMELITKSVS